jgi:cytosine/adenosine deaminase-related metal-dependent hydrolase
MLRVAVAPCSPFSVTDHLMKDSAQLARALGVRLHTHIAETADEERFCLERFGVRPLELLEGWGWLGTDVWLAHCVHLSDQDIRAISETGTGVAWCPTSNLRLGSGIARARPLLEAGATVGLGVDGSASNDAGSMLAEVRQATLVSRAGGIESGLSAREALRVATRGSAGCLGREDLGSIEAGKRGDVALFSVEGMSWTGAESDPVAAVVHCSPARVWSLLVEGRAVVEGGHLVNADEDALAREGRRLGQRVAKGS